MIDAPGAATRLPSWRVERILYDERGLLVVDKPINMPVHGGDETLAHSVVARLSDWLVASARDDYLAVHQRLDQETSGVLFFITDRKKNADFAAAMESHTIERTYLAVVSASKGARSHRPRGEQLLKDSSRVELWLSHAKGVSTVSTSAAPKRAKNEGGVPGKSKRAVTHYKVVERRGDRILVALRLETGRTHQIRATLAHLGFPVVGDKLYGGRPASRMMLHAHTLSGGPLGRKFEARVPEIFSRAMGEQEDLFPIDPTEALADAVVLRSPLVNRTAAFRLVNGAGDGLRGLTIDAYGRFALLNIYDEALFTRRDELSSFLLSIGFAGVYEKARVRADLRGQDASSLAPEKQLAGSEAPAVFVVDEWGLQLNIELGRGLSTGLFVDMRDNRFRARAWGKGGRMLNLFCYTSSFSVAAALSGSVTTNVDISGNALARGRANFQANGLDPATHRFFREDAMKFLSRAVRRKEKYEFIVLDPPSFATVGKGNFSVKGRYGEAASDCVKLLSSGGRLLCVTNHTKTTIESLKKTLETVVRATSRRVRTLKVLNAGLDCPSWPEGPWPSKSILIEIE